MAPIAPSISPFWRSARARTYRLLASPWRSATTRASSTASATFDSAVSDCTRIGVDLGHRVQDVHLRGAVLQLPQHRKSAGEGLEGEIGIAALVLHHPVNRDRLRHRRAIPRFFGELERAAQGLLRLRALSLLKERDRDGTLRPSDATGQVQRALELERALIRLQRVVTSPVASTLRRCCE